MQMESHNPKSFICFMDADDLASHGIKQADLYYGSTAYRKLRAFLLREAAERFGISGNDLPFRIEVIPVENGDVYIEGELIDEAEELDPRFSQFSINTYEDYELEEANEDFNDENDDEDDEDEPESYFSPAPVMKAPSTISPKLKASPDTIFTFSSFEALTGAISSYRNDTEFVNLPSTLFYNQDEGIFALIIKNSSKLHKESAGFTYLYEYANPKPATAASIAYINEHYACLIKSKAIKKLSESTK